MHGTAMVRERYVIAKETMGWTALSVLNMKYYSIARSEILS